MTATDRRLQICIVGAGVGGLAALRVLKAHGQRALPPWNITVYESREAVGGVWLPSSPNEVDPPFSPIYDSLTSNLPHPTMWFHEFPFPPETSLFPSANVVLDYLRSYARHFELLAHIQFNSNVTSLARSPDSTWSVSLSDSSSRSFDRVVIANGHYRYPRLPDTPGAAEWLTSGLATHSAYYRRPTFHHKCILVVGAGPSGQDLAWDMSQSNTVYHSITGGECSNEGPIKVRPRVKRFGVPGTVEFVDGTTLERIDHCFFATGYELRFPQIEGLRHEPPTIFDRLPSHLNNSTYHLFPLTKEVFPVQEDYAPSSLAFLGLMVRVSPFPLMEAQAEAIARVFEEPAHLNVVKEKVIVESQMRTLQERLVDPVAVAKAWHRSYPEEKQYQYRRDMLNFAGTGGRWHPEDWEEQMYMEKITLREQWRELERAGEAEKWLKGVGKGGTEEWVALMRKLLKRAQGSDGEHD